LEKLRIGLALTGSYCTYDKALAAAEDLVIRAFLLQKQTRPLYKASGAVVLYMADCIAAEKIDLMAVVHVNVFCAIGCFETDLLIKNGSWLWNIHPIQFFHYFLPFLIFFSVSYSAFTVNEKNVQNQHK